MRRPHHWGGSAGRGRGGAKGHLWVIRSLRLVKVHRIARFSKITDKWHELSTILFFGITLLIISELT